MEGCTYGYQNLLFGLDNYKENFPFGLSVWN